jgi:hemerythrin-like domain-containing protein
LSNEENDLDRLRQDHREIRDLVDALRKETAPEPCLAYARTFADKLEQHIRFEERDIFPLVERTIPPDSLDALDRRLHAQFRRVVEDFEGPDFWT